MSWEGDEVTVSFHPIPSPEVQEDILSAAINNNSQDHGDVKDESSKRITFGP